MATRIKLLIGLVMLGICDLAWSETNSLWFEKYDPSIFRSRSFSPSQFFNAIQSESQRIDPKSCGVRIIYKSTPFENEATNLTYSEFEHLESLADILYSGVELLGLECAIIDDIALIGRKSIRCVTVNFTGRCYNATSGGPIIDFQIESFPWNGALAISTNGDYTCSLSCQVEINVGDGIMYLPIKGPVWEQEFTVRAPGYKPRKFKINALLPGKSSSVHIDIELKEE